MKTQQPVVSHTEAESAALEKVPQPRALSLEVIPLEIVYLCCGDSTEARGDTTTRGGWIAIDTRMGTLNRTVLLRLRGVFPRVEPRIVGAVLRIEG